MGFYGQIADIYDSLFPVSEEQATFCRHLLRENRLRSIIDAGCGTGRHLELYAGRGLRLAGVEPEVEMAAAAVDRMQALGETLAMAVCPIEESLGRFDKAFELGLCLGNTLAHLDSMERLDAGLNVISRQLTPWGILVTQTVNFDKVLREMRSPFKERRIEDPERGTLVFRREYKFESAPEQLIFRLELSGDSLQLQEDIPLKPYTVAQQRDALERAQFHVEHVYGDWDGRDCAADSPAAIIVARR